MNVTEIAENKLQSIIDNSKEINKQAVTSIAATIPTDHLMDAKSLRYWTDNGNLKVGKDKPWNMHPHALGQLSQKLGIPTKYTRALLAEDVWSRELLAKNLGELTRHRAINSRFLLRTVDNEVRGFLSDHYLPISSELILDKFTRAAHKHSAYIQDYKTTDTRWCIKIIIPKMYKPGGDPMTLGVTLSHSDFGQGALELSVYLLRLLCTNGLIAGSKLKQVHLGKRLDETTFSLRTNRLEDATIGSKIVDILDTTLAPESVDAQMGIIEKAMKDDLRPGEAIKALQTKSLISKEEQEQLLNLYASGDIEELPPGNNRWRLSQSLSLLSKNVDAERNIELQKLGGDILNQTKL